ncbi:hypothetical protein [Nonomuraea sp. NPDC050643]|uniref:hypothetical protein n=1 Tax=Nonomuraea sp. NPDC050643 TaxID=3155660 RepID=UPI0033F6BBDC
MKAVVKPVIRVVAVSTLTTGALAVALLGPAPAQAARALQGPAGQAISAGSGPAAVAAGPCRKVTSGNKDTIRVWFCDGTRGTALGYHAQGFMGERATLTLQSASGAILRTVKATHTGVLARWYNTGTYRATPGGGGLYKACWIGGVCTGTGA